MDNYTGGTVDLGQLVRFLRGARAAVQPEVQGGFGARLGAFLNPQNVEQLEEFNRFKEAFGPQLEELQGQQDPREAAARRVQLSQVLAQSNPQYSQNPMVQGALGIGSEANLGLIRARTPEDISGVAGLQAAANPRQGPAWAQVPTNIQTDQAAAAAAQAMEQYRRGQETRANERQPLLLQKDQASAFASGQSGRASGAAADLRGVKLQQLLNPGSVPPAPVNEYQQKQLEGQERKAYFDQAGQIHSEIMRAWLRAQQDGTTPDVLPALEARWKQANELLKQTGQPEVAPPWGVKQRMPPPLPEAATMDPDPLGVLR